MKRPLYNAVRSLFRKPRHFLSALCFRLSFLFPDKLYLKMIHRLELGRKLDLKNPKTYNDKLQWLKLYCHRPEFTMMADKVAVKPFVASRIGAEYVAPLLGVWDRVEEIDWESLPQKFVLKTNHDGGNFGVVICRDKDSFDREKAEKRLKASLRRNTYLLGREWPYKNIPRKVFAEEYIEDKGREELLDYKFYCFDGKVRIVFIASGRQSQKEVCIDYYDADGNHIDGLRQSHPNAPVPPEKPVHFDLMKSLAENLSEGIPHVRVDFFEANGNVYFSELTFFPYGGWALFHPEKYDLELGSYIRLPEHKLV